MWFAFKNNVKYSQNEGGAGDSGKDGASAKSELSKDEAIAKASADLEKKDGDKKDESAKGSDDSKGANDSNAAKDDSSKKNDDSSDDLDAEALASAKNLYKALKDPNSAHLVLETLAKAAGMKLEQIETKKEEKAAVKSIKEIIAEKLGPDYKFLSAKLGEAIEEAVSEHLKTVDAKFEELSAKEQAKTLEQSQNEVFGKYENVVGNTKLEKEILSVMDEIAPGPTTTPEKWFQTCLEVAAKNLKIELKLKNSDTKKESQNDRNKKNSEDAFSRMASERGNGGNAKDAPKGPMTIQEAIRMAEKTLASKG